MEIGSERYNCPHCWAFSHHNWYPISGVLRNFNINNSVVVNTPFFLSNCVSCNEYCIWNNQGNILYPLKDWQIPPPNMYMEDDVRKDYIEAASIFLLSPRGACALLRLALQKLLKQIWESWNIATDLHSLITKNVLSKHVLKAIDVTRYFWNEAVHPWILRIEDNPQLALTLFFLINTITYQCLELPEEMSALHEIIPEEKQIVTN